MRHISVALMDQSETFLIVPWKNQQGQLAGSTENDRAIWMAAPNPGVTANLAAMPGTAAVMATVISFEGASLGIVYNNGELALEPTKRPFAYVTRDENDSLGVLMPSIPLLVLAPNVIRDELDDMLISTGSTFLAYYARLL